jgi:hypothetical protein
LQGLLAELNPIWASLSILRAKPSVAAISTSIFVVNGFGCGFYCPFRAKAVTKQAKKWASLGGIGRDHR